MASLPRSCRLAARRVSSTSSLRKPEPAGHPRGELGDALRVAAGVDVARVDGASEARRCPEARSPVGPAREPLQLGELDHVRPVGADTVLAVLLRPVERAVGEADQLVAVAACAGEVATPTLTVTEPICSSSSARSARRSTRRRERAVLVVAGQEQRELVAAEPERLACLPQPRGEPREDAVARRVAEAVVDPLEVVDVDEAEGEREAASPERAELRSSRSWKWRWLPRPVSGSVRASRIARSAPTIARW